MATFTDFRSRRIPNRLVLPFLAGGVVVTGARYGLKGLGQSMGGIVLAAGVTGILCWLRGMGAGDMKLCAAVGAWIGPAQLGMALIATGLAGGAFALIWALCHGSLSQSLDGVGDLFAALRTKGVQPHPTLNLDNPSARTMPYAPAIAIGTIFSFLTT